MKTLGVIPLLLVFCASAFAAPTIFMIGDSTMCNYPANVPTRGWGMGFAALVRPPAVVDNHAASGRSTKSFLDEGRWQKVADRLQPGDFVIIQFAHNDEKKEDPKRYTDPATTFRDNLRRFIRETRAHGGQPILATPVSRRQFNREGKIVPSHGAYPDAIRAVAKEEHVPLLDLERATKKWLESLGDEPSRKFFVWLEPGAHPKFPNGSQDNTHFVDAGADVVARLAAALIREQDLPLAEWLK